jgi:hypothetical protein
MQRDDLPQQTARDRRAVVEEAGLSRLSFVSVLAGTLAAYGAFALVAAIAGALLDAADVDTDFTTNDWSSTGAIGGLATGVVLLLAYLFGGYVAGRMARRDGMLHGIAVALLSIIGGGIAGAVIGAVADDADVERNLRSIGVPTSWDDWSGVAVATAIVAVAAVIIGSIVGAMYGERWHARLVRRAADPSIGPAAAAQRRADEMAAERDEMVQREAWPAGTRAGDGEVERDRQPETIDLRDQPRRSDERVAIGHDGDGEEPRYTAAEWQRMREAQATSAAPPQPGRSSQRF